MVPIGPPVVSGLQGVEEGVLGSGWFATGMFRQSKLIRRERSRTIKFGSRSGDRGSADLGALPHEYRLGWVVETLGWFGSGLRAVEARGAGVCLVVARKWDAGSQRSRVRLRRIIGTDVDGRGTRV